MYVRVIFHIVLMSMLFCSVGLSAQLAATAVVQRENGTASDADITLNAGDSYSGSAPLEIRFIALPSGDNVRYEWNFSEYPTFSSTFLTRFDSETTYTFNSSGTFYVRLQSTDMDTGISDETDPFVIRIAESELRVPNAFSPNGDGVNDVFRVSHKSLISFDATVFNRWGQKLYHWGLENIDGGWDGTAHGAQVPVGVYYVVVKAKGADGVVYNHKGDINILR
jgi:gliding motility-associated-like protein